MTDTHESPPMKVKQKPLTDDQRKVLETERDNPEATPKEIAGLIPDPAIGPKYVQQVIHNFELEDEPNTTTQTVADKVSATTDESEMKETEPEPEPEPETPKGKADRPLDDLGDKSKIVIEYAQNNPEDGYAEIKEALSDDVSDTTVRVSLQKFSQHIDPDHKIWDGLDHPLKTTKADHVTGRKARQIVKDIQNNPQTKKAEIAEMNDTYETHVTTVMQTYDHLMPDEWCARYPSLRGTAPTPVPGPMAGTVKDPEEEETVDRSRSRVLDDFFDDDGNLNVIRDIPEDPEPTEGGAEEVALEMTSDEVDDVAITFSEYLDMTETIEVLKKEADRFEMTPSTDMTLYAEGMRHVLESIGAE